MKKTSIIAIGALVVAGLFLTSAVFAFGGNNKDGFKVNGEHYNLNIIGKERHADVGDSSGHTMFVLENGKTRIYMTQDLDLGEFKVVDRNGLDGRAEFNIAPGHYNIYAIALGKPGGKVKICANANFTDAVEGTKLILLGCVDISRERRKPQSENINELFYVDVTLTIFDEESGETVEVVYEDFWVFDIPELLDYYWDYDSDGLKLLQVRFYGCTLVNADELASGDYPKDYCRWADGTPIVSTKDGVMAA